MASVNSAGQFADATSGSAGAIPSGANYLVAAYSALGGVGPSCTYGGVSVPLISSEQASGANSIYVFAVPTASLGSASGTTLSISDPGSPPFQQLAYWWLDDVDTSSPVVAGESGSGRQASQPGAAFISPTPSGNRISLFVGSIDNVGDASGTSGNWTSSVTTPSNDMGMSIWDTGSATTSSPGNGADMLAGTSLSVYAWVYITLEGTSTAGTTNADASGALASSTSTAYADAETGAVPVVNADASGALAANASTAYADAEVAADPTPLNTDASGALASNTATAYADAEVAADSTPLNADASGALAPSESTAYADADTGVATGTTNADASGALAPTESTAYADAETAAAPIVNADASGALSVSQSTSYADGEVAADPTPVNADVSGALARAQATAYADAEVGSAGPPVNADASGGLAASQSTAYADIEAVEPAPPRVSRGGSAQRRQRRRLVQTIQDPEVFDDEEGLFVALIAAIM